MKKKILIALVLSLTLSGCSTYQDVGGHTRMGDPAICRQSDASMCLLLFGAAIIGCGLALSNSR